MYFLNHSELRVENNMKMPIKQLTITMVLINK